MADEQDPLRWATDAFKDKRLTDRYDLYRRYAAGDQDLRFATPKYATTFGTLFREFGYNRCATVVDAHADRLQVERFTVEHDSGGLQGSETAGDLWRRNRMDGRAGEVHKAALRDGDAYLIVWPETGTAMGESAAFPQFWPQRADQIRVRYDDEQPGLIVMAAKTWTLGDGRRRLNVYYPDRTEKYVTPTRASTVRAEAFVRFEAPGEPWPVDNPWGTVPVFHFANNADTGAYGTSELRDVIPLQDGLNKALTDLLLACELAGFPQKVILGLDSADPTVAEGLRRLEAGLNKMFTIPFAADGEKPSIAEFTAVNLPQLIAVVELFDKLISRVSRVPIHYLQMSGDFPSGRAVRTAEAPFVSKIEDRQISFGNVWEDAMHLALRMAGLSDPGMLTTVWKPAAPLSAEDTADLALQWNAIGIPLETIMRAVMGFDEEEIEAVTTALDAAAERQVAMFSTAAAGGETLERAADEEGEAA